MCINRDCFLHFLDNIVIFGTNKNHYMKKIIIWLAKVFHVELPKAEVIKEYKWIPLDGKITGNVVIEGDVLIKGNVEVTGNLTATGYITTRGSDSETEFPYPVYESGSKEFENLLESSNWNSNNE